jgi:elastase-1
LYARYFQNDVLTAAHCCDGFDASDFTVVAGDHNLVNNEGTEQRVGVDKIVIHEDYNSDTIKNDICILKLKSDLELNR